MGSGLEPATVGLRTLFSEGERDSEAAPVNFFDFPDQALYAPDEFGIIPLAALYGY